MFDSPPETFWSGSLQQHPCFGAALRACGRVPVFLEGAEPIQVLRRRFFGGLDVAMIARASLPSPERLVERIRQSDLNRHLFLLSPDHPAPQLSRIGAVPVMTPATVAEIDLTTPQYTRRAALHGKWRNRLAFAEKQGLRVTRQNMPGKPGHWIMRAEAAQQARVGYRHWPEALTLAYGRESPGAAKVFTAFEGRDPIAAMLFLRHGIGATYHIGQTSARGRVLSAHHLLLWRASCWLAGKGHRNLDLGVIDTARASGLARFKLGSGAVARILGGTWGWWPPLRKTLRPLAVLDRMGWG